MQRNRRQLPDFRYVTIGEDTYYLPYYIKSLALTLGLAIGLTSPVVIFVLTMWALW